MEKKRPRWSKVVGPAPARPTGEHCAVGPAPVRRVGGPSGSAGNRRVVWTLVLRDFVSSREICEILGMMLTLCRCVELSILMPAAL